MTDPNDIRDKAAKECADRAAAQAAWERVRADGRCHGKTSRACRLAMLTAIANGSTAAEAEKAAMRILES